MFKKRLVVDAWRVPVVCYLLPNFEGGGAERVALNIMRALPEAGRRLVLFEKKMDYVCDAPVNVLRGDFASNGSRIKRLYQAGAGLIELARLKREVRAASWLSFTTLANILNVLTPSSSPTVISSHNRESENIKGRSAPLMRALVSFTYPRADVVVAVSESVKTDLVEKFGVPAHKIVTIYNTVDLAEIAALKAEPLARPLSDVLAGSSIVTVGRLIQQKGQWHLLRAFATLRQRMPEAKLVVVGKGLLGVSLAQTARELGLRVWAAWESPSPDAMAHADVVFVGFLANPFAVVSRARVFAFPSLWEGFGNAIIEALACGVPVVASDCVAGPREILAPEAAIDRTAVVPEYSSAGILMPPLDGQKRAASEALSSAEQAWCDTLAHVLGDDELRKRYAAQGLSRAASFSIDVVAGRWRDVLLGKSAHGPAGMTRS